jgi:hypothetical protein
MHLVAPARTTRITRSVAAPQPGDSFRKAYRTADLARRPPTSPGTQRDPDFEPRVVAYRRIFCSRALGWPQCHGRSDCPVRCVSWAAVVGLLFARDSMPNVRILCRVSGHSSRWSTSASQRGQRQSDALAGRKATLARSARRQTRSGPIIGKSGKPARSTSRHGAHSSPSAIPMATLGPRSNSPADLAPPAGRARTLLRFLARAAAACQPAE